MRADKEITMYRVTIRISILNFSKSVEPILEYCAEIL